jgi:hypothetical protein
MTIFSGNLAVATATPPSQERLSTPPTTKPARRPIINVSAQQLRDVTSETIRALERANDPPALFVRSGELVRIREDEIGRPITEAVNEAILRNHMSQAADFVRTTKTLTTTDVVAPMYIPKDILASGTWNFPPLSSVVEIPVLRPDGSILDTRGYDRATGLYYWPKSGLVVPEIPKHPSPQQIRQSLALIEGATGEFPYAGPASRANALALLLTPVIRHAIKGEVPIALLDAPQQGSGKSLLGKVVATVATGRDAAMMAAPDSDEEWRKRITATLYSGATVITIDNIEGRLAAPSLAGVLTADTWRDRILGASKILDLPNRATWLATGNNIRLGGDLQRRCYWIRLDAKSATPWTGRTYRHPRLTQWVAEHRGELVAALLTLARAWWVEGRPSAKITTLGGFEEWCETIGGVLAVAGVAGFLENLTELYEVADEESAEWERFLRALEAKYGGAGFTTAAVVTDLACDPSPLLETLPGDLADTWYDPEKRAGFNRRLGKALSSRSERRYGSNQHRIEHVGEERSAQVWRVVSGSPETWKETVM